MWIFLWLMEDWLRGNSLSSSESGAWKASWTREEIERQTRSKPGLASRDLVQHPPSRKPEEREQEEVFSTRTRGKLFIPAHAAPLWGGGGGDDVTDTSSINWCISIRWFLFHIWGSVFFIYEERNRILSGSDTFTTGTCPHNSGEG